MSRKGFPQNEYLYEIAADRVQPHGSPAYTRTWEAYYLRYTAESEGPNTPGWPHAKQQNPYTGYRSTTRPSPCRFSAQLGNDPTTATFITGDYPSTWLTGSFEPASNYNDSRVGPDDLRPRLIQKLQSKIKNQKVNLGVVAAEFKKTCATVTDIAHRITNAVDGVRSGNIRGALDALGGVGGSGYGGGRGGSGGRRDPRKKPKKPPAPTGSVSRDWLAIQYGWKPLLSDVYGACEELARTMTYRPPVMTAVATVNGEEEISRMFARIASHCPDFRGVRKCNASMRAVIEYRVSNQLAALMGSTGLSNPQSVLWETIPYSFVVDWFWTVGTYLNNLDYALGLEFSRGWITYKSTGTWKLKVLPGTYVGGDWTYNWSSGSVTNDTRYFHREVLSEFPTVVPPQFKDPRSLLHVANAIALLRLAFS